MNHLFATYELSLLAKEKGFDEPCLRYYDYSKILIESGVYKCKAPLYQQLCDWFREKYDIVITVSYCEYGIKTENGWRFTFDNPTGQQHWQGKSNSYYESLIKAIEQVFKLI